MAQAILLQDVVDLGRRGEAVDVAPGYLRNYLVPASSPSRRPRGRWRRPSAADAGSRREVRRAGAGGARSRGRRPASSKTVLTIHQRAGEDGKLFGSVGLLEIADAIREARDLRIDRRKIHLEQPIREIGTFMVEIELADGVTAAVKTIVAEEK